jgi:hypothetical protein
MVYNSYTIMANLATPIEANVTQHNTIDEITWAL